MNRKQIVTTLSLGLMGLILLMFAGCDRLTLKTVNIRIEAVDIASISEERPAEVLFAIGGIKADGCDPSIQKVHAQRVGNTIFLEATGSEERFDSGGYCTSMVESTAGTIVVKALEVGEYKVATHDGFELLQFRIEKGTSYVGKKAGIGDITVEMKTSEGIVMDTLKYPYRASYVVRKAGTEDITVSYPFVVRQAGLEGIRVEYPGVYTDEPIQVSIGVEAYLMSRACEYSPKIVIDKGSSGNLMNVEIFGEVPFTADCIQHQDLDSVAYELIFGPSNRFEVQIDLGTFETGDYRVNINGADEVGFSIRRFSIR